MSKLAVVKPEPPQTPLRSLARDWLASARAGGKSPRTLEAYRWPVYNLLVPACEREGIDSPTKIDRRVLDRPHPGPLGPHPAPASPRSYPPPIHRLLRPCAPGGAGPAAAGP